MSKYLAFMDPKTATNQERKEIEEEFHKASHNMFRLSVYDGVNPQDSFFFKMVLCGQGSLAAENSLIAVSGPRHEGIGSNVEKITGVDIYSGIDDVSELDPRKSGGEFKEYTPFLITQFGLLSRAGMDPTDNIVSAAGTKRIQKTAKYLGHCLREVESGLFEIGTDCTWISESITEEKARELFRSVTSNPEGRALLETFRRQQGIESK